MAVLNKYHHGNRVPPGAVSVMRGTPFGNPFVIGRDGDRAEVIRRYRLWLWSRLRSDPAFAERVRALHGRDLCCCCAPAACHGDVLERAAAWLAAGTPQSAGLPYDGAMTPTASAEGGGYACPAAP